MAEDGFPTQMKELYQPVVTIFQRLRIVQIVSSVVVQRLLRIARGGDVVLHGSLVEVLLIIRELEQQGNRRRPSNEMDGVDVASDLRVSFQLTGRRRTGHPHLWWLLQFESRATRPAHP
jgi:hypothetical protein